MVIVLPRDRIILDSDLFSFRQAFCDASEKLLPHVLRPHATAADRDAQSHLWITHSADAGDATSDDNGDSASHRPSIHQQFVWTATAPHITVAKVWLCVCVCVCVCVHVRARGPSFVSICFVCFGGGGGGWVCVGGWLW